MSKIPRSNCFGNGGKPFSGLERRRASEPLLNRFWQVNSRPALRNTLGQSKSSLQWSEVLTSNKIVLISLAGLPEEEASLLGTLLVTSLWSAAQSPEPEYSNVLILDEFQLMLNIPMSLDSMLRLARKQKLPMVLATQYMENLPQDLSAAITNSVSTKVIYKTLQREARHWKNNFLNSRLTENDFMAARTHEGIAQIALAGGMSSAPVTLKALPPATPTGSAAHVHKFSTAKYGRPVQEVVDEIFNRRSVADKKNETKLGIGTLEWDVDGGEDEDEGTETK